MIKIQRGRDIRGKSQGNGKVKKQQQQQKKTTTTIKWEK